MKVTQPIGVVVANDLRRRFNFVHAHGVDSLASLQSEIHADRQPRVMIAVVSAFRKDHFAFVGSDGTPKRILYHQGEEAEVIQALLGGDEVARSQPKSVSFIDRYLFELHQPPLW